MQKIIIIYLTTISYCYCQMDGKFWWTDSRIAKYHKVNIPEPIIEDISPWETDESSKIVFRDESPHENHANMKTVYSNKEVASNASADICHYVEKHKCRGIIYSTKYGKSVNKGPRDPKMVCCLEATRQATEEDSKIYFPDFRKIYNYKNNRIGARISKRSASINQKRSSTVYDDQADDDEDPYWNIKNANFHNSQKNHNADIKHDFVDELPRPGLVGIYSDAGTRPEWSTQDQGSSPSYGIGFEYDEVDDTPSFGYSFIDPRKGAKISKRKLKPFKLQTSSEEKITYDPRYQIINFQSDPDFKVFEGFKLLNIVKINKNIPENINESNQSEKSQESSFYGSEEIFSGEMDKVFRECGKSIEIKETDQERGDALVGSHPWLALVVDTARRNSVLCYGTVIHPRVAVTIADCVDNKISPGELTLIAGMQYLNRRSRVSRSISQVIIHPDYAPGHFANDLSLLIWQVPLKLSVTIQPACIADRGNGRGCMFFGWGGFGAAMQSRSSWQRGKLRACSSRITSMKGLPADYFCVGIEPGQSLVTGRGGPLICKVNGRDAVVGILVARRQTTLLLPVQDWVMQATDRINDDTKSL